MGKDNDLRLTRLEELKGYQVAEGDHDIRGWEVRTPDGNKIGKVEELIVDPAERRVRYMEVKVDHKALGFDNDRHILVPIGAARIKEDGKDVLIERLPAQGLAGAPPYTRGPITRDYETHLRNYYGATAAPLSEDYYKDDLYDDSRIRSHRLDDTMMSPLPRIGDNEVTLPLAADQEIIVRRPGGDEIVIRKNKPGDATTRD